MNKNTFIFLFFLLICKTNFGSIYTDNITLVKISTEYSENIVLGLLDSNTLANSYELSHSRKIEYLNSHFDYLKDFVFHNLNRCIPCGLRYSWNLYKEQLQFNKIEIGFLDLNLNSKIPEQFETKTEEEKELNFACLKINSLQNWILTN